MTNQYNRLFGHGLIVIFAFFSIQALHAQCPPGPLYITTQMQIDEFANEYPNCEDLNALLSLEGPDITDFSPLNNIKSIGGNLTIFKTQADEINFPNLTRIDGSFNYTENKARDLVLTNLETAQNILVALSDSLRSVNFPSIDSLNQFDVELCSNVESVKLESLSWCQNFSLGFELPALKTVNINSLIGIEMSFIIQSTGLENLNAFSNIQYVNNSILIINNDKLTDCSGLCRLLQTGQNANSITIESNSTTCNIQDNLLSVCEGLPKVEGKIVYAQTEAECLGPDAIEIPFVRVKLTNDTDLRTTYTNQNGYYRYFVPDGNFDLDMELENNIAVAVDPLDVMVTIPDDNSIIDYCITPLQSCIDLGVEFHPVGVARPGFPAEYNLIFINRGTDPEDAWVNLNYPHEFMNFESAELPIEVIDENTIRITALDLKPFEERSIGVSFILNSPVDDPPLDMGDELNYTAFIFPAEDDKDRSNNFAKLEQLVVNAFDPNDKTALHGDHILIDSLDNFIHYQIRFENLGNAAAINVRVDDFLDAAYFEISTLEIIDASHLMNLGIEGQQASFVFSNILLGFEEPNNDGYVVFKIKPKADLQLGDVIKNEASIYFDFNPAIVTNLSNILITKDDDGDGFFWDEDCDDLNAMINPDAEEILGNGIDEDCDGKDNTTSTDEHNHSAYQIYPNPAHDLIQIIYEQNESFQVEIFNDLGQRILHRTSFKSASSLDISILANGIYFIKVYHPENNMQQCHKFVKH